MPAYFCTKCIDMVNVLAVEDLREDRFILKKLLAPYFNVTTLSSAVEAKAFAKTHTFDVALLNVMLKDDLDCIELLKDLELISNSIFLPIAITCHIDRPRYKKVMAAGFKAILKKPFDKNVFNEFVSDNVKQRSSEIGDTAYQLNSQSVAAVRNFFP